MKKVFYNETALNGKYQVKSETDLSGKGIKKYGTNDIHTHNGEIHKGLNNFWVDAQAFALIKAMPNSVRTSF